ncbi:ABC transporter substrate-binding protein [Streptomyces sp. NPDC058000]|uniref:ABC transporter substrate-binding protein n=1 Tax=Streptomyces sp. NPDC058000 TaxID=3346299 RepID=UPI0036ED856A
MGTTGSGPAVRRGRAAVRAAALALGLGLLAGCAGPAGPDRAGAAGDGTLVFATGRQPDCLDPQVSPTDIAAVIDRNIFDSLVRMAPDGSFRPWLARTWTVSPDGRTYTFRLRPGVTFHDGTRLDATAVKATLDHAVAPTTKSQYAAGLVSAYQRAEVPDPLTVRVHLKARNTPFLQALSTAYLGIQSPASMSANAGGLCGHPVGSGPFRFVNWTKNSGVGLIRNDAYRWPAEGTAAHGAGRRPRALEIRFITEEASRFGALTSGQADVIDDVPPAQVKNLRSYPGLHSLSAAAPGAVYALLLNSRSGPLADERVRRALLACVDLDRLVKAVEFGQFPRAWSPIGPTTPGYDRSVVGTWRYDPAAAARLLDQAGWTGRDAEGYRTKDGTRLRLRWPYAAQYQTAANTLAQGIQAEAKKAGIDIAYVGEDTGTFGDTLARRTLDMYGTSFVRAEPDILRFFYASDQTHDRGGGNIFGVSDPELDRALHTAAHEAVPARRDREYATAQQLLLRKALVMPVYVPMKLVGAADRVRGLSFDPAGFPLLSDVRFQETSR